MKRIAYFDNRIEPGLKPGFNELPGDYTDGETPDSIPNSEAKPVRPMVVLAGESRSSPGFISPDSKSFRGFPFTLAGCLWDSLVKFHQYMPMGKRIESMYGRLALPIPAGQYSLP